jgi:hypothetical protein
VARSIIGLSPHLKRKLTQATGVLCDLSGGALQLSGVPLINNRVTGVATLKSSMVILGSVPPISRDALQLAQRENP